MTNKEFQDWAIQQRLERRRQGPRCPGCGVPLQRLSETYTEDGHAYCSSDCAMEAQVRAVEDGAWLSLSDDC